MPHIGRALRLNPHDPSLWTFFAGRSIAFLLLHRYAEAADDARHAARQPSANFLALATLASALGHLGETDDARAANDTTILASRCRRVGALHRIKRSRRARTENRAGYRVPITDRTRCPVHTAATAMHTVAMPIRPIRQAYSLDL